MTKSIIDYIEKDLSEVDKNRIWTLIDSCKLKGRDLVVQIERWRNKLINKEHIDGTPWNIPNAEKKIVREQWSKIIIKE